MNKDRPAWMKPLVALTAALMAAVTAVFPSFAHAAPDGWQAEPVPSSENSSQRCAQLLFIGARGSGEDPGQSRTIKSIRDQIAAQPGVTKRVRQIYIDYPAKDIDPTVLEDIQTLLLDDEITKVAYWDSTYQGVAEVKRVLLENVERCPNEKIVIVGFSQGAEAVNRGLTQAVKESPKVAENLVAALLMGNPGNYSGQHVQILDGESNQGSGGLSTTLWFLRSRTLSGDKSRYEQVQGILRGIFDLYENKVPADELQPFMVELDYDIPEQIADRVYSVCNDGDMICNSLPALSRILSAQSSIQTELNKAEPIHLSYPDTAKNSVAAIGRAISDQVNPSASPEPADDVQPSGQPWLWFALGGVLILGVLGIIVGRRRGKAKN